MKNSTLFIAAALASALVTMPAWAIERPVSTPLPKPPATKPTRPFTPIVVQTEQQPQRQAQAQSQKVHVDAPVLQMSSSLSLDVQAQERNPVATATAPALATSNGTCMGSTSGGAQGASFGFSVGGTWVDAGCDARYDAQALTALGLKAAAVARLCAKPELRDAIERTGQSCFDKPKDKESLCLDPSGVPYADPLVAARACPAKPQD